MSFGWSAGDIVLGISTLVKVGKAIKETGGAASEYQEALSILKSIEATLRGLETIAASNPGLVLNVQLAEQARLLKSAVDDFRKKVEKYDLSLGSDSNRRKVRRIPREVQFALSEKIRELQTAIIQPQLVLDVCINLHTLSSILELSQSNALSQNSVQTLTANISSVMRTITDSLSTIKQSVEMQSMQCTATHQEIRLGQENIAQSMQELSSSTNDRLEILLTSIQRQSTSSSSNPTQAQERALHQHSEPRVAGSVPLQVATGAFGMVATAVASAVGILTALRFYTPKDHQQYEVPSSDSVRCDSPSQVPAESPPDDTTCKEAVALVARCLSYNSKVVSRDTEDRAGALQKETQVTNPDSHLKNRYMVDSQVVPSVADSEPDRRIIPPKPLATQDLGGVDDEPHETKQHWEKLPSKQSSAMSSTTKAYYTGESYTGESYTGESYMGESYMGESYMGESYTKRSHPGTSHTRPSSTIGHSTRGSSTQGSSNVGSSTKRPFTKRSSNKESSTKGTSWKASSKGASFTGEFSRKASSTRQSSSDASYYTGESYYTVTSTGASFTGASSTKSPTSEKSPKNEKQVDDIEWEWEWACCECPLLGSSLYMTSICMTTRMESCPNCMHSRCPECTLERHAIKWKAVQR